MVFNSPPLCSCNAIGCLYHNQVAKYYFNTLALQTNDGYKYMITSVAFLNT